MTNTAPGGPGLEPRLTSSAKEAIGTSRSAASPVWFSLSHGILNEVYYPRIDQVSVRDGEFLLSTPDGRFFEEKRDGLHHTQQVGESIPGFDITVSDPDDRFRISKRYVTDPLRPVLLVATTFTGDYPLDEVSLVFLLAPHLANHGYGNTAWIDTYKGTPIAYATRNNQALGVAIDAPLAAVSIGYVGESDGWQQFRRHNRLVDLWDRAEDGNVAISLQPDLEACGGRFTLAIGFGSSPAEAGQRTIASSRDGFATCLGRYEHEWRIWGKQLSFPERSDRLAHTSALVLATHEAKTFRGGLIASLSIPWGSSKGDGELAGYHLVWPRDHTEAAGGFFAIGAHEDGMRALSYLRATQEADGHWSQNMWLDGTPYWGGVQMDETALPILLVDLARHVGAIDTTGIISEYWPMIRSAAGYVVRNGPVTGQDRWEEDGGYSPFTLSAEIAALLVAAAVASQAGEHEVARYLSETADCWNGHLETWCYAAGTELARSTGVDGYYVRIGPPDEGDAGTVLDGWVPIKNRPPGEDMRPARSVVSPDALAFVRFGLRSPDDPRIRSTLRVIDATLREEFPYGPGWRRYTNDGYGEHTDGSPFDGTGRGRIWPLLTGERAHYELAAGRFREAAGLAVTMRAMAGASGLLPEQTWDAPDLPGRELFYGKPAGSAMPLVWAHAEYLKLERSIADGRVFDTPSAVVRHSADPTSTHRRFWRQNHKIKQMDSDSSLRIELTEPAVIRWSVAGGSPVSSATADTGIGMHILDLDAAELAPSGDLTFTIERAGAARNEYTIERRRK
jgi:glucoamylase